MWLFRIANGFDPIFFASRKAMILRSSRDDVSRQKCQLKIAARLLCGLTVIAFCNLAFSPAVHAAVSNGAKPFIKINLATSIINYFNGKNACSATYISNATLRAECSSYLSALSTTVSTWKSRYTAGTLTVAYDETVQTDLYDYESDLQAVLVAAGYSASPPPPKKPPPCGKADTSSGVQPLACDVVGGEPTDISLAADHPSAYQIAPDEIPSPDDSNSPACTNCTIAVTKSGLACGALGFAAGAAAVVPVLAVGLGVAAVTCTLGAP